MDPEARREAEAHAATCTACREELASLRLTLDAMSTLREEEIPRRIAFVSDKVFEPRWWQRVFNPAFAAGCLVAGAILVHAFVRPVSDQQVQARIDAAVERAVSQEMENRLAVLDVRDKQYGQWYTTAVGLVRQ